MTDTFGTADAQQPAVLPLQLLPSGDELPGREDQTLLDSCIVAGIAVPYNCRSGECGECRATLVSGTVHELPGADPAVFTSADRARGEILTCMCFPRSAVTLKVELDRRAEAIRPATFDATVERVEQLTPTICGVTVRTPQPIHFHAGQNFEWVLSGVAPNRTYSAANRPGSNVIEFHVRVYPGGKVGDVVTHMSVGYKFKVIGPFGQFALSANPWRPTVCVAGGTGLAPVLSTLDRAFCEGDRRAVKLLYGARTQDELYCLDKLQRWAGMYNFELVPVLSDEPPDSGWKGQRGLVTDALARELTDVFGLEACICGPPAMIDAAVKVLEAAGIPAEDIRTDRFVQAKS